MHQMECRGLYAVVEWSKNKRDVMLMVDELSRLPVWIYRGRMDAFKAHIRAGEQTKLLGRLKTDVRTQGSKWKTWMDGSNL